MALTEEQKRRLNERNAQQSQQTQQTNTQTTEPTPKHNHQEVANQAQGAANCAMVNLNNQSTSNLGNVAHYINRVSESRNQLIDDAATTIAFLHDPRILEAEIFVKAQQKLTDAQNSPYHNPYEGISVQPPVLPTAVAGYLPR